MTMEEALEAFAAEAPENALSTDPSERLTLKDAFNRLAEDLANLPETLNAEPELVTQTLETDHPEIWLGPIVFAQLKLRRLGSGRFHIV